MSTSQRPTGIRLPRHLQGWPQAGSKIHHKYQPLNIVAREHDMGHYIRNSLYFQMLDSLRAGVSVVMSGSRLSGRSSLLRRLSEEADSRLRPALVVVPTGRESGPLESIRYALAERDYEPGPTRSSLLVTLRRHLEESDGPILIDNAHRLDTESLIALEQVTERTGRSAVITTSTMQARLRRDGNTLFPDAVQLALTPIGMEGATALIADVLDGAPENGTTALILSKSGGIPGIIVALACDGRSSGALYEKNGVWTSPGTIGRLGRRVRCFL